MSKHYLCELVRRWGRRWGRHNERGWKQAFMYTWWSISSTGKKRCSGGKWHAEWLRSRLGWRNSIWLQTCQCGTCVHIGGSALQRLECPCWMSPPRPTHLPQQPIRRTEIDIYCLLGPIYKYPALPWQFIFGCGILTCNLFRQWWYYIWEWLLPWRLRNRKYPMT